MKKTLSIIGIIVIVLIVIILIVFGVLNKEKTPISANTFISTMESKGYTIINTTSQFSQYPNYVAESYIAKNQDYQIEFYELTNKENAINMYNTNKTKFESQKTDSSSYVTVNMSNYSTYSLTAGGKYKYLARIDNTLVYIDVDENYKDIVKDIMKEIGY